MSIDRNVAPQPGPPRPYHFPHVARRTLDNGLRLVVAENHNAPLVSVRTLIRSGADYDTPDLAGLASLTGEQRDWWAAVQQYRDREWGYVHLQRTKPQTPASRCAG